MFEMSETPVFEGIQSASDASLSGNSDETLYATALTFPASLASVAAAISAELGFTCNVNTLKSRWMPDRILPAYECFQTPAIKDSEGKITQFGYEAIRNYIAACIKGQDGIKVSPEDFKEGLSKQFTQDAFIAGVKRLAETNADRTESLATRQKSIAEQIADKQAAEEAFKAQVQQDRELREAEEKQREELEVQAMRDRIRRKLLLEMEIERQMREELGLGK